MGFNLRPLWSKPPVEATSEGVCGLVGSPDCPIVEEEGCQIYGVVDGFSLCAPFRSGSIKAKGEEQWAFWAALLHTPFARDRLRAKKDKTVIRVAMVAISGQALRHSSDFSKKTMWLKALSKSMVRHRISSLSCFRNQRLVVWTTASRPFLVPNPRSGGRRYRAMSSETVACWLSRCETFSDGYWPVAVVLLLLRCEQGTGDQRGNGAWNVALGMMRTVAWRQRSNSSLYPWRRPPLMCCGRGPDGPAAVWSKEQ